MGPKSVQPVFAAVAAAGGRRKGRLVLLAHRMGIRPRIFAYARLFSSSHVAQNTTFHMAINKNSAVKRAVSRNMPPPLPYPINTARNHAPAPTPPTPAAPRLALPCHADLAPKVCRFISNLGIRPMRCGKSMRNRQVRRDSPYRAAAPA